MGEGVIRIQLQGLPVFSKRIIQFQLRLMNYPGLKVKLLSPSIKPLIFPLLISYSLGFAWKLFRGLRFEIPLLLTTSRLNRLAILCFSSIPLIFSSILSIVSAWMEGSRFLPLKPSKSVPYFWAWNTHVVFVQR